MPAGPRELLRHPAFRRLYATRLAGQLTDGVLEASLAGFVLFSPERATTAPRIAAAAAVVLLPYSAVGPVAGVLIDRIDRRRVLVVANLVRAVLVAVLGTVVGTGYAGPGFYVLALLAFSTNRFVLSALSAATPATVQPADLVTANALSTTSGTAATIVGLGAGSVLAGVAGGGDGGDLVTALTAAALYAVCSVVARRLPVGLLRPAGASGGALHAVGHAVRDVADGARHLWHRPVARSALLALAGHRFFFGLSTVATVLVFRNLFAGRTGLVPGGAPGLGIVVVAAGAGAVLGAVVTPWVTRRMRPSTWVITLLSAAAVAGPALALPYRPVPLVVASLLLGVVSQGSKICVDSLVQRSVDDAYRGRAFAFYDQLFNVAYAAAAAVGAVVLPASGRSYGVIAVVATGYALVAIGYGLASARARSATGDASPDRASGGWSAGAPATSPALSGR